MAVGKDKERIIITLNKNINEVVISLSKEDTRGRSNYINRLIELDLKRRGMNVHKIKKDNDYKEEILNKVFEGKFDE